LSAAPCFDSLPLVSIDSGKAISASIAARIGGMDRQTLRDWIHRFNELGPDRQIDRTVRWRSVDLKRV
jgi:Winged helix-turn helix